MSEAPAHKQLPTTVYDKMTFPDYAFREFPMAVPVVGGKVQDSPYNAKGKPHPVVIVNSQDELDALKGPEVDLVEVSPGVINSPLRVQNEDDIREALYVQADQTGAKIDKRWSVERIEQTIKDHVAKKDGGGAVV